MAARVILLTSMLLAFFAGTIAHVAAEEPTIATRDNSDYFGFDFLTEKDISLDQCKQSCLGNSGCAAFTYNTSARFCFLKSDFGRLNPFEGAIAGRVIRSGASNDMGAPPQLKFVPQYMRDEARKFKAGLANTRNVADNQGHLALSSFAMQAFADRNTKAAIENLISALKILPNDVDNWLVLSQAALSHRVKSSKNIRSMQKMATSAALNAYLQSRSRSTRAAALARLAAALHARRQYRPALTAYRQSLDLDELPAERANYVELRRTHGFRVLNHTIDSDNQNPRICIQFSENLVSDLVDYEKFMVINNAPPAGMDVKKRQICAEGLEHGKTYHVKLRQGLPSSVSETLLTNVNLDIYIRDRKPSARFTGANFVLPISARRGIPLVTVNAEEAKLELYRVGERALAGLLRDSRFLKQLQVYQVEELAENLGQPVWKGNIAIKPLLNRDVITSIPVDQALPRRQPGVYMMVAEPKSAGPENYGVRATQWFVISDIGLTTFSGGGKGAMQVFARSLSSAKPISDVKISLIARNNELLGSTTTNADGLASIDAGLLRGKGGLAPQLITAANGAADFVFLDVSKPGFDFSDRGVTGRPVPGDVDVYAWSERGIYRAGETVHVAALARDPAAKAISGLPLTFIFTRPDGVEHRRIVDKGEAMGGYAVQLPLSANAKRGTWQMRVHTDPKLDPVAEQRFLVEDFFPDRTDFTLQAEQQTIASGQSTAVKVTGRYLYGAPATGLALEGQLLVRTTRNREGFSGYLFGLSEETNGLVENFPLGKIAPLNAAGKANLKVLLGATKATSRPQTAELVVQMREGSGRAIERKTSLSVAANGTMIGIRPEFAEKQVAENSIAGFTVLAVDQNSGQTGLSGARWSLVKVERNYQWYRDDYGWHYESVDLESKVGDGVLDLVADTPTRLSLPVEWGRYRLTITGAGAATSIVFNAGWYVEQKTTDTPDGLEIALDKSSYRAGDIAQLKVSPRFAGELLIAIGSQNIVDTKTVTVPATGATVDIPVQAKWGAGAYVLATLYRPGDAGASRMPMRAIGVKWLAVDPEQRALKITLDLPQQTKPNQPLSVPVSVKGVRPGEEAYVTVAAVDIGILNLTSYQSPDPLKRYFGQRRLGVEMRDIYGRLIDGSAGATGTLRSGGDGSDGMRSNGSPPTEKLVSFFHGPVRLDENGKALVEFDIPQFNGSVRVMATSWTADGVGASEKEIIIRDPVVVAASMPRFMAPGDTSRLLVEITNTDAPSGVYGINVEAGDHLEFPPDSIPDSIELAQGGKQTLKLPFIAKSVGESWASIGLSGPDGIAIAHNVAIKVRPGQLPLTRKLKTPLAANGGRLLVDRELLADSKLDGAKINISVARPSSIDVPSLLLQLNAYPYGCAEQITSKALPLLYVSEFATHNIAGLDGEVITKRVQKAVDTVLSYQSSSGGFSLWGNGSDDLWLGAYVTDFLTRAAEKGYLVPEQPRKLALQHLQNVLAYQSDLKQNDAAIAYALYVLARNRMASASDLRYYADTQLQAFRTPISQAQLAASMALYGDSQRAQRVFGSAFNLAQRSGNTNQGRYSFGSGLRDASAMLALASESNPQPANMSSMQRLVSSLASEDRYTNTQEKAWMLLAARAAKKADEKITVEVNGERRTGAVALRLNGADLLATPMRLTNTHSDDLQAIITTIAVPSQPLPAGGQGFEIQRQYYRMDGSPTSVADVAQNERFVVVLKVVQLRDLPSRLIVTDLLPAGLEIDNPRLVSSAALANFKWLPNTAAAHTEFRDDRFIAAFNRAKGGDTAFTLAYTVRAVTPGVYTHPAAHVEDMYRPELAARTAAGWMQVR